MQPKQNPINDLNLKLNLSKVSEPSRINQKRKNSKVVLGQWSQPQVAKLPMRN